LFSVTGKNFLETVKKLPFFILGAIIEMLAHFSARREFQKGKVPYAWKTIESTKQLRA